MPNKKEIVVENPATHEKKNEKQFPLCLKSNIQKPHQMKEKLHVSANKPADPLKSFWDGGWADLKKVQLHDAIKKNDLRMVNFLIKQNNVDYLWTNPETQKNVLHLACEHNREEILAYLMGLESISMLIHTFDKDNRTPSDYGITNPKISELLESVEGEEQVQAELLLEKLQFKN